MAIIIKRKADPKAAPAPKRAAQKAKPDLQAAEAYPDEGVHLMASPWELKDARGKEGNTQEPLCGAKGESVHLFRKVTCPRCLYYISDVLGKTDYLIDTQWPLLNRPVPEGCPTEEFPYRGLSEADNSFYKRAVRLADRETPNEPPRKPSPPSEGAPARERPTVTAKPKPDIYNEF